MRVALDELDLDPRAGAMLWDYLVAAADSLVNTLDALPPAPTVTGVAGVPGAPTPGDGFRAGS
jgi:hypothetical protein